MNNQPQRRQRHKVILDCDPGLDDTVAILLALASHNEIDLLGITTVAGNVSVDLTQRNARFICEQAGVANTTVYAGCSTPLLRKLEDASHVHGMTGLGSCKVVEPQCPVNPTHAVDFIIEQLTHAEEKSITLVPIGPLTNIALALFKAPHLSSKVREIVMMGGGGREGGNVTAAAEFNVYADPHAAEIVFQSGCPLVVMSLDVTHQALGTPERLQPLEGSKAPIAPFLNGVMNDMNEASVSFGNEACTMHDPCTIAYLIKPELFSGEMVHVAVETQSELTMGMTVVDWRKKPKHLHNALWMTSLSANGLYDLIFQRILNLGS